MFNDTHNGQTHWDDCWKEHHACAVEKVERFRKAVNILKQQLETCAIEPTKGVKIDGWIEFIIISSQQALDKIDKLLGDE